MVVVVAMFVQVLLLIVSPLILTPFIWLTLADGFGGADKIFLMEFTMPMDGKTGFNGDMPAIWMLNAKIPRTIQYGKAECSCWSSGCGE